MVQSIHFTNLPQKVQLIILAIKQEESARERALCQLTECCEGD